MICKVSAGDLTQLRLNEEDTVTSVLQNIAVILSTAKGTVPLYRDFGLDWRFLDKPMPAAEVLMISEVREAIERWEPRATVLDVSYPKNISDLGLLIPIVEVEISDE